MDIPDQPRDRSSRFSQLQDQLIIATSALEQLELSQQEAKREAVKWSRRIGLAWQFCRFDCWLEALDYRDHYILKSGQLKQKIEEYTQHVEQLKSEWAQLKQESDYQEQMSLVEQKFQQVLKLSQEAIKDLKSLHGQVIKSQT
jgi:hypothetical protein